MLLLANLHVKKRTVANRTPPIRGFAFDDNGIGKFIIENTDAVIYN